MNRNVISSRGRVHGIDAARGFTVALMILVNNGHGTAWPALRHALWNGLTLSDLVFPFFLFIMGCSMWLSMSRRGFAYTPAAMRHILRRTLILFAIGIAVNWLDRAAGGVFALGTLRFWGVMQRIALCYLIVSILALTPLRNHFTYIIILILIGYSLLLHFGHGYAQDSAVNILSVIDRRIFGEPHLYHKSPVDPEGLASTLSAVASVLCGFVCARYALADGDNMKKIYRLSGAGLAMTAVGLIIALWLPINKRVWSPSFVLVTAGLCALLTALSIYLTDVAKNRCSRRITKPFMIFGSNALALYVLSELLAIGAGAIKIRTIGTGAVGTGAVGTGAVRADDLLYNAIAAFIACPPLASLCYALAFTSICFIPGYILHRRKILIKL